MIRGKDLLHLVRVEKKPAARRVSFFPPGSRTVPLVGNVKFLLRNEGNARKVRDLRQSAISRTHELHDAFIPHRSIDAIAQARCGPARVRMARRAVASRHAELLRLHLHRLIPPHRGDRSPRSPEATRTPSGSSTRGRFVSGVRKGIHHTIKTRLHRAPEASGHCWPEAGKRREGAGMRRAWMLRHGRQADAVAHGLALSIHVGGANAEHRSNGPQRHGFARPVRCARRCRGVCRGSGEGVPRADESSEVEQRRKPLATGSNPVRPPLDSSVG